MSERRQNFMTILTMDTTLNNTLSNLYYYDCLFFNNKLTLVASPILLKLFYLIIK